MPRAAVLGAPIDHSLSPVLHNAGYAALGLEDWEYDRQECTAEQLPGLVREAAADVRGFSVTMPGKFAAVEVADEVTDRARLLGSANTLVPLDGGRWRADNTDTEGVVGALQRLLGDQQVGEAVVIGAGGTARPALWALAQRGVDTVTVLNRSDRRAELEPLARELGLDLRTTDFHTDLEQLSLNTGVIVSTVPSAALEDHLLDLAHAPVLDVIYEPWPTPLTVAAAANGYATVNGHIMLAHQAFSQFEQFTGQPAPQEEMITALNNALAARQSPVVNRAKRS